MQCDDIRKHLADYLTQPADVPAPVMEHVTACGDCKNEFAALFDLWEELGRMAPPAPDSEALRARFQAAIAEAAAPVEPVPARTTPWWRVRPAWTMKVAALAASAALVAFLAVAEWQPEYRGGRGGYGKSSAATDAAAPARGEILDRVKPADEFKEVTGLAFDYNGARTELKREPYNQFVVPEDGQQARGGQDANRNYANAEKAGAPGGRGGSGQRGEGGRKALQDLNDLELYSARSQFESLSKRADAPAGATQLAQQRQMEAESMGRRLATVGATASAETAVSKPMIATLTARNETGFNNSARQMEQQSGEVYDRVFDNAFVPVVQERLATFGTDVDTASYANVRRFLNQNQLPPKNAVRIEELLNYFRYSYPQGSTDHPITAAVEVASAPWNPEHRLVRIGLKAKDVRLDRQPTNLVFLVDVSGSMSSNDKLPLLKSGLRMMTSQLTENDKITIVTYAGSTGVALQATNGLEKNTILQAIEGLNAQGSTNGGSGIQMAYAAAVSNFIKGGVNRVILATDGDFNVGITSTDELVRLIEDKAKSGVFLSVLGFGTGNLNDSLMEKLADRGNGNYAYIDSMDEARKVLVDDIAGTLVTVAKDVKIQVEFNPSEATAYRLIGYENRALAAADFADDRKDAGDMGAGHTVTALFEVVPRGVEIKTIDGQPLRFLQPAATVPPNARPSTELLNLKIRYKQPDGATSKIIELPLVDRKRSFADASPDFRFAAAVAAFGMILRDSPHKGTSNWELVRSIAQNSRNQDRTGARDEFIRMVGQAQQLWRR